MIRIRHEHGLPVALPGVAPVAMLEGKHPTAVVKDRLEGLPRGAGPHAGSEPHLGAVATGNGPCRRLSDSSQDKHPWAAG